MTLNVGVNMPSYELAHEAEDDLRDIARYNIDTWGADQAERYAASLENHFETLAKHTLLLALI